MWKCKLTLYILIPAANEINIKLFIILSLRTLTEARQCNQWLPVAQWEVLQASTAARPLLYSCMSSLCNFIAHNLWCILAVCIELFFQLHMLQVNCFISDILYNFMCAVLHLVLFLWISSFTEIKGEMLPQWRNCKSCFFPYARSSLLLPLTLNCANQCCLFPHDFSSCNWKG